MGPARTPPPAPPSPPAPTSLLLTIVLWLTGISTWNRAAIALVLGGALLAGLLIYRNPTATFELLETALHEPPAPTTRRTMTLYASDVQRELENLLAAFAPQMIGATAWRIDLEGNRLTLVRAVAVPEFAPALAAVTATRWHWPVALFSDNPKTNDLLARLSLGRFVCTPAADAWPDALSRFPIAELCLVAIPPDGGLSGMLGAAFRTPVPDPDRPRLEMAFRTAAAALTWPAPR